MQKSGVPLACCLGPTASRSKIPASGKMGAVLGATDCQTELLASCGPPPPKRSGLNGLAHRFGAPLYIDRAVELCISLYLWLKTVIFGDENN